MLLHTLYKWELHNGEIEIISFVVNFSSYPYAIFISSNISGFNFLFLLGFFSDIFQNEDGLETGYYSIVIVHLFKFISKYV